MKSLLRLPLAAMAILSVLLFVSLPLFGQNPPGATDKEITIGSCSALEGPSKFLGTQTVAGARAYFESINEQGGIHGRKLKLIASDDSYDPAKAEECFIHLQKQGVFALGFLWEHPPRSNTCRSRKPTRFRSS